MARIQGITIELDGDTTGLTQALKKVDGETKNVQKELRQVERLLKFDPSNVELLSQKQKLLGDAVQSTSKRLDALKLAQAEVERQFKNGEIGEEQYRAFQRELVATEGKLNNFEGQLKDTQSKLDQFGKKMGEMGDSLKSAGGKMTSTGKDLSMKVTAPIVAMGVAITKTALDFEAQMDRVGAISGATGDQMTKLKDTAMELGASTSKSASEVAIGMENMAAMGFEVNEIVAAMPGIISAAEASGADMAQTADVVAASLNMFGLEASEASRVADILAQSANQSSADITDLQYALKYAGPPAAALGISLEETAAAIGLMTDAGMQGEQAGTTLRSALLSLLQPSEKNSKLMDKLGIAVTDADGKMLGISDIVRNLSASLDGMTEANKAATLASIFGKEAVSGMLTLIAAGPEQIDAMTASLENSAGASKEAADQMMDNLKGSLEELGGAFETLSIQLGNILIPIIRDVATVIQGIVEWFSNLSTETQKTILAVAGITAVIGPLLIVAGMLISSIGTIMSAFGGMSVAIAGAGGSMGVISSVMAALTGPIGLVIAGVVALGAAMVAAYTNFDGFRDKVNSVFTEVKNIATSVLQAVVSFVRDQLTTLSKFWNENGTQILKAATNAFNGIKTVIDFVMPAIKLVIETIWNAIKQVITGALDVIMGAVKVFSGLFTGDFSKMWEGVKQIFSGAIDLLMGLMTLSFVGGIRTLLANLGKNAFNLMKGMWDDVARAFSNGVKSANTSVVNFIKNIGTNFKSLLTNTTQVFSNMWRSVVDSVTKLATGSVNAIKGLPAKFLQIGKELMQGLINGIKDMTQNAIGAITGVVNGVVEKAKSLLGIASPSKVFTQIGKWTGEGLEKGITSTKKTNEKAMKDITDVITNITKKNASEVSAIAKKAEEERTKVQNDYQKKRSNMKKKDATKIRDLEADMHEKLKKINDKAWADMQKKESEVAAARVEAINSFIENKKKANELSLIDEAEYWRVSYKQFDTGTKENLALQQSYQDNVKRINDALTNVNDSYLTRTQQINNELAKSEQDLNQKYTDTLNSRYQTILGYYGLFDAVAKSEAVDKSELTGNLQDQVSSLKDWSSQIEQLKKRKVSSGLITELQGMGVKALEQLKALNSMTDAELSNYQKLYQQKMKVAKEQAIKELEPMKKETQNQIQALRDAANIELSKLNTEWQNAIKKVVGGTDQQLKTLHQVGKNAGQGLLNGLSSMEGSLINKAQEMASSISKTIQSALKIKSPSRVMMGFGENIGEGLIIGMDDMLKKVAHSSARLSDAVVNAQSSLASSTQKSAAASSSVVTNQTKITNSTPINVTLNYNGTGSMQDASQMIDFIEAELGSRLNSRLRMSGVKT